MMPILRQFHPATTAARFPVAETRFSIEVAWSRITVQTIDRL